MKKATETLEARPYRGAPDLEAMRTILVAGRQAAGPTHYVHVGDLAWWLYFLDQGPDLGQRIFLWGRHTGEVRGWTLLSPQFSAFDVFLHPDEYRSPHWMRPWIWSEEQMAHRLVADGRGELQTIWISEKDERLHRHLFRRGFCRSEEFMIDLQFPLAGTLPLSQPPSGYQIRHVAGEHEAEARAAASHAAFGSGQAFNRYVERYHQFMRSPVYVPERDIVAAVAGGQIAAFAITWLDMENGVGHFEPVGTHPEHRRQGLARAVLEEGLRRMKQWGMSVAHVCVAHDNAAAQALYTSLGFQSMGKLRTYYKRLPVAAQCRELPGE